MADPIPGEFEDWVEIEPDRWAVPDHPEYGVITLTPPLTFEEYYAERASEPITPPAELEQESVTRAEFDALEARVTALEQTAGNNRT